MRHVLKTFRVLALLQLTGCTINMLPVVVYDETLDDPRVLKPLEELPIEVEMACRFWGIECFAHDDSYGALVLSIVEEIGPHVNGRNDLDATALCFAVLKTEPDPVIIAHEMGHVLTVGDLSEHHPDPLNVMYHSAHFDTDTFDDVWASEEQRNGVQAAVFGFSLCAEHH